MVILCGVSHGFANFYESGKVHNCINVVFTEYLIQNICITEIAFDEFTVFDGIFVTAAQIVQGNNIGARF